MSSAFLTAEWRKLIMANYVIKPELLRSYVPPQTELDLFENRCYVTLVGFMFLDTRVRGWQIPFHSDFEEVNLRFYVRHRGEVGDWKRGVVFVKEIVPKPALSLIANVVYGEHYQTMPMSHRWELNEDGLSVEYQWKSAQWNRLMVRADTTPVRWSEGSEVEFITEHFWGYTKLNEASTSEYQVEHPAWLVYPVHTYHIDVDFEEVYGPTFAFLAKQEPKSVYLAEGSGISVYKGRRVAG